MTPTEQGDTNAISPRRRCSPPNQHERAKFKSTSLPKLEEDTDMVAVSPVKEKKAGKIHSYVHDNIAWRSSLYNVCVHSIVLCCI